MEVRSIKKDKIKEFLKDFHGNAEKWYKKQMEEDFVFDEETQLEIINYDGYLYFNCIIRFIKNPTKFACLEAVKKNGDSIQFIKNPTDEMKLEAIKQNGLAIKYIDNPTEEMILESIKKGNSSAFQYIKNPTKEMCMEILEYNGSVINYIENPTKEMKLLAIKYGGFKYIDDVCNDEEKLEIIHDNPYAITFIKNKNKIMQLMTVKNNGFNIKYIEEPYEEVCIKAIENAYESLDHIDKKFITQSIVDTFFEMCDKKGYTYTEVMNSCFYNIPKKFINKKYALIMIDVDPENVNILRKDLRDEIVNEKDWLKKYVKYDCDDFLE